MNKEPPSHPARHETLVDAIRRYLATHPAAADTVEGIAGWAVGAVASATADEVRGALSHLESRGEVAKRHVEGAEVFAHIGEPPRTSGTVRIGIDLGGTKTEIIVLDAAGGERLRRRVQTPHEDYDAILALTLSPTASFWLFGAFFLAFAVKVPMFPFHTWLPDAHVEAPTAGSVILASILLKLGTYGFLRIALPFFPGVAMYPWVRTTIIVLAVIGVIYGSLVALVQPDIKKLVAYSSVAHLGFVVNGEPVEVAFAPHKTLLEVLREDLGLTGTKHGCELGECGTCAVLVDGRPVLSCLYLGLECEGRSVETVEGMASAAGLHPLQKAFADLGAAQCGYCTPGFLLTARALLDSNPRPTLPEIREALAGNLCRCTGYVKIFEAVELAAAWMRGEETQPRTETLYGTSFDESGLLPVVRS